MTEISNRLPIPDPTMLAHSEKLVQFIRDEMAQANGQITFARFMELALYAPGLGYYSAGLHKFGKEGDFVTAPEITPLFARCLAVQCQQVLTALGGGDILEFGAGTGVMAADLLLELEKHNCLPARYLILEVSAELRQRQQQLLQKRIPHLFNRIVWLDHLPYEPIKGIILANEVLDAMPVHKFRIHAGEMQEYYVKWGSNSFVWQLNQAGSVLAEQIQRLDIKAEYYDSEINLQIPAWMKSVGKCLDQGMVLIIDYGFPQHEYYHLDRNMGTLMCHYRQRAHIDPLILVGLQDITAHVDFTLVAESAAAENFQVAGFNSQAAFLLGCGLLKLIEDDSNDIYEQMDVSRQVHLLTAPSEMGELFKTIALTKELKSLNPVGFSLIDQRGRL